MANKYFRSQFSMGYAVPVKLRAKIAFDALGDATIESGTGMGIASITHNSAGDYSILLSDSYAALLGMEISMLSGNAAPAAPVISIRSEAVSTLAAPVIRIQMRNLSGVLADPADGEIAYMQIELHNSSVSY